MKEMVPVDLSCRRTAPESCAPKEKKMLVSYCSLELFHKSSGMGKEKKKKKREKNVSGLRPCRCIISLRHS
jgi:hypothetical protein